MLDHLTHADSLEVSIEHHPCARAEWEIKRAPIGATVAEIVVMSKIDCARFGTFPTVILVRGDRIDVVPLTMWRKVRPKSGTRVEIAFPLGEPGTIALIASAALPHAAAAAATALNLTGWAYALTVAAITVVGALTINALIPPAQQQGNGSGPQNYAITGVANVANRYGSFPYVIGRHRMFPPLTASGYSETVGRTIFYRGRMTFGYGPVALEDLRIGTTPIWQYDGVELEFLNVDRDRSLAAMPQLANLVIARNEEAQTPRAFVAPSGGAYVFAPDGIAKNASLTITPSPLAYYASLDVVVEVSEDGGAWSLAASYPGITAPVTFSAGTFSDGVSRSWRVRISAATEAGGVPSSVLRRKSSEGITVTAASAAYQMPTAAWRKGSETMRLYPKDVAEDGYSDVPQLNDPVVKYTRLATTSAAIDLTFPQGLYKTRSSGKISGHGTDFQFEYQSTEGGLNAGDWTNLGVHNIHAKSSTLYRWTKHITFPAPGEYAIRITRRWLIDTDPGDVNTATLTAIRSFGDGDLPSHEGIAEVAFRIKASEQLNGQIDSLNAIVQQLAPIWDGAAWSEPQPIRHPAWAFLQALRGPHLRRPVPSSRIDLEALRAWAEQEPHWTCDYVVDTPTQVADVLDVIAASGRAKRTLADLKWSVIRESAADPVRQVFTPRNSWNFKAEHRFPREIHGFRVKVRSERLEWQEDEILVLMDGYTRETASELETLELPGVVVSADNEDEGNAFRLGRYHLASALHRPATYTLQTGWEHLRVTRGDKVRLVHDAALIGVGQGRIKAVGDDGSGGLASITLDDCLYGASGEFRLTVRTVAGEVIVTATAPADPTTRLWTIAAASGIAAADVAPGDLAIVEEMAQQSAEMLVTAIRPNTEDGAELVLVDSAPEILDAYSGTIPPYDPIVTAPRDPATDSLPPLPVVTTVYSDYRSQLEQPDLSVLPRAGVELAPFTTGVSTAGMAVQLRWRDVDGGAWVYGEMLTGGEYQPLTGALSEGEDYEIEVATFGGAGRTRGWVPAGTVTASTIAPAPVLIDAVFAPTTIKDAGGTDRRAAISLTWTPPVGGAKAVAWEIKPTGQAAIYGQTVDISAGSYLLEGVLPGTQYQCRASYLTGGNATNWTAYQTITTGAVKLGGADLELSGLIDETSFASGIAGLLIVSALPTSGNYEGRTVILTTDSLIYRFFEGEWTAQILATQIVGQLIASQIAAGAIGADQLAAGAVLTKHLLVGDLTNLVKNGDLVDTATDAATYWDFVNAGTYGYDAAELYRGRPTLFATKSSPEVSQRFWGKAGDMFRAEAGEEFAVEVVAKGSAAAAAGLFIIIDWYDAAKSTLLQQDFLLNNGAIPNDWTDYQLSATCPAGIGAVYGRARILNHSSQTDCLTLWLGKWRIWRKVGAVEIGNGAVRAEHVAAGSMNADIIGAGKLDADYLNINKMLELDSVNAGFRIGKFSVADYVTDGAYFGSTDDGAGGLGFGFFVGRTDNGENQYIRCTEGDGLELQNAQFLITTGIGSNASTRNNGTITFDPSTETMALTLVGGGHGGYGGTGRKSLGEGEYQYYPGGPGSPGGTTTVRLYDGATLIQTWTATGGNGYNSTSAGQSRGRGDLAGNGGDGGDNAGATSGAQKGGLAGQVVTVATLNIAALTDPKIEVTIGAGGAGGAHGGYGSGTAGKPGQKGVVDYQVSGRAGLEARPVSLKASQGGTMGFSAGTYSLPSFGAKTRGFWNISSVPSGFQVQLGDGLTAVCHVNGGSISFVTEGPVTYYSPSSGTLRYTFWPMDN